MEITKENITAHKILELMEHIYDPEIPVLSIIDLGIIRDIQLNKDDIEVLDYTNIQWLSRNGCQFQ